ncbi:diguanylate cyclase [Roseomonas terrae]|uniref:Diguanylate cyclase n=1 Tax=Neoroseomonas terrae TaxID=424799 RepID=A0ABS5ELM8_9PROT|nr:diguanylate cyclase [Neoroseomonas terrae]MBR0651925.1 diguanylate cyclase [Neoroseomonas terrae]
MKALLWDLACGAALLLSIVALVVAGRAAVAWRHERSRIIGILVAAGALLAGMVTAGADILTDQPAKLIDWLRLPGAIALPVFVLALLRSLQRRDALARNTARDAPFDRITGLAGRPLLQRQLVPALARCRREGSPAILLVIGIDGLAALRAQRGPGPATELLRGLATILGDATRAGDLAGHVEADVLAVLLTDATGEAAESIAERLRGLAAEHLVNPAMDGRRITVSVGIAEVGDGTETAALEEAMSTATGAYREALAAGGDGMRLAAAPPARSVAFSA